MVQMFVFDPAYIRRCESRIDYWGIGMLAVWIGALQIAFDKGQELDWFSSRFITVLIVIAVSFAIGFLVRELMAEHPVVNLHVFMLAQLRRRGVSDDRARLRAVRQHVVLPIWLQTLLGYPAMTTGLTMAPRGIGSMLGMPLIGMTVGRFDPRKILAVGLFLGALSTWQLAQLNLNAGYWDLFWPQLIQGFGLGMVFVPLTTISMDPVPREGMGNATSLFNLMRNLGGSVGIAVVTLMNTRFTQKYTTILGAHVASGNASTGQWFGSLRSLYLGTGSGPGLADQQAYASLFGMVERQAAMRAFVDVFQLLTIAFVLMIPLTLVMRRPKGSEGGGMGGH